VKLTRLLPLTLVATSCAEEPAALDTELDCQALDFSSCGGKIKGNWGVTSSCAERLSESSLLDGCPQADLHPDGGLAGSIRFEEDGQMAVSLKERLRFRIIVPKSCLPDVDSCLQGEPVQECHELEVLFDGSCVGEQDGESLFTCTDQSQHCACAATAVTTEPIMGELSYSAQGGQLRLKGENKSVSFDYCVQDRILTLSWIDAGHPKIGEYRRYLRLLRLE